MISSFLIFIASLVGLIWSANLLVEKSKTMATRLGLSTLVISMTIVALGTSLPELASSVVASFQGHSSIALGNVIGSNICNLALILGATAFYCPMKISKNFLFREGMELFIISFGFAAVAYLIPQITMGIGIVFLILFVLSIYFITRKKTNNIPLVDVKTKDHGSKLYFLIALSFVGIIISSKGLVYSAVNLAVIFGVSEEIIALSLIAGGTSIPELFVSLIAVRKGEGDLVLGNIVGSNIANILLVLGAGSIFSPIVFNEVIRTIDIPIMLALTSLSLLFMYNKRCMSRIEGGILLFLYFGYLLRCAIIP